MIIEDICGLNVWCNKLLSNIVSLGENGLLVPIVLSISGVLAIFAILGNRNNIRDRETIAYLMNRNADDEFLDSVKTLVKIHNCDDTDIKKYTQPEFINSPEHIKLRHLLNHYEYLSIGILNNIYSEKMMKEAVRGTTLTVYECLQVYINKLRDDKKSQKPYKEFTKLYNKWSKKG